MHNEREHLLARHHSRGDATFPATVNSRAYSRVRRRWIDRHIWDERWGALPGMRWKHERRCASSAGTGRVPAAAAAAAEASDAACNNSDDDDDEETESNASSLSPAKAVARRFEQEREERIRRQEAVERRWLRREEQMGWRERIKRREEMAETMRRRREREIRRERGDRVARGEEEP